MPGRWRSSGRFRPLTLDGCMWQAQRISGRLGGRDSMRFIQLRPNGWSSWLASGVQQRTAKQEG